MRFSANTRYAIRLLFELDGLNKPVATASLAEKTGMSLRTVENIHTILRLHKLTTGTVGAKGGIRLLVPLAKISLGALIRIFDEGVKFAVCCGDKANDCPNQKNCKIRCAWNSVSAHIEQYLDNIFLADILSRYPQGPDGPILNIFHDNLPV